MQFSKKNRVDRGKSLIFLIFLFLGNGALAESPQKILSTNLCADFLLIHYVNHKILDSNRILALSPFLKRYGAGVSTNLPTHSGSVESIVNLSPDLIVSGVFDSSQTRALLQKQGFSIFTLNVAQNLSEIPQIEAEFLSALGISKNFATLPEPPIARPNPPRVLMLGASLIATGKATFENSLIESAGFQNAVDFAGFQTVSLEKIVKNPPDFLLFTTPADSPSFSTKILENPIFKNIPKIENANDWRWQCAGPWSWELLKNLKKISG